MEDGEFFFTEDGLKIIRNVSK